MASTHSPIGELRRASAVLGKQRAVKESPFAFTCKYLIIVVMSLCVAVMAWGAIGLAMGSPGMLGGAMVPVLWIGLMAIALVLDNRGKNRPQQELQALPAALRTELQRYLDLAVSVSPGYPRVAFNLSQPPLTVDMTATLLEDFAVVAERQRVPLDVVSFVERQDVKLTPRADAPGLFTLRLPAGEFSALAEPADLSRLKAWLTPAV